MSHAAYMSDRDLLPRATAGDGEALATLVDRHAARLYALAFSLSQDTAQAAEATVQAFARLAEGATPLPNAAPDTVLDLAVAATTLARSRRHSARLRQLRRSAAAQHRAAGMGDRLADGIAAALAELPLRDRAILELGARRGFTDATLAALLDCPADELPAARRAAEDALGAALAAAGQPPMPVAALAARPAAPLTTAGAEDIRWRVLQTLPPERRPAPEPAALVLPPPGDARTPGATTETLPAFAPAADFPGLPAGGSGAAARERRERRSLDRYVERRLPVGRLVALAALAVLIALGAARFLPADSGEVAATAPLTGRAVPSRTRTFGRLEPTAPPSATEAATTVAVAPTAAPTPIPAVAAAPTATAEPTATAAPEPTAPAPLPTLPGARAALVPPTPAPPTPVTPAASRPAATPTKATTARLALDTPSLNLGVEIGPRVIAFTNPGGDPLEWRIVADSTWLEIAPQSGALAPGASTQVSVSVARGALPTGAYTGNVEILTNGGDGSIPVTMLISPSNTAVSAFLAPVAPINAAGCAAPTTHTVSAAIAGTAPPAQAAVYYSLNGGPARTQPLAANGRVYAATIGPFTEPGGVTYSLVITEADGNVVRSAAYTLAVNDCPGRERRVSAILPITQAFTLGQGGHNIYSFPIAQPGNIVIQARWQGSTPRLSTLLYGPRRADQPYEQRTGTTNGGPLAFAFPVTEADVAAGGLWELHLINFDRGDATGALTITFEPRKAATPTPAPSPTPTAAPVTRTATRPPASPTR